MSAESQRQGEQAAGEGRGSRLVSPSPQACCLEPPGSASMCGGHCGLLQKLCPVQDARGSTRGALIHRLGLLPNSPEK